MRDIRLSYEMITHTLLLSLNSFSSVRTSLSNLSFPLRHSLFVSPSFALVPYEMGFTFQTSDCSLSCKPVITDNEPLQDTVLLQSKVFNNSSIKRAVPFIIVSISHQKSSSEFFSFSLVILPSCESSHVSRASSTLSFDQMLIQAFFPSSFPVFAAFICFVSHPSLLFLSKLIESSGGYIYIYTRYTLHQQRHK